jgi:hypothetical protein
MIGDAPGRVLALLGWPVAIVIVVILIIAVIYWRRSRL